MGDDGASSGLGPTFAPATCWESATTPVGLSDPVKAWNYPDGGQCRI